MLYMMESVCMSTLEEVKEASLNLPCRNFIEHHNLALVQYRPRKTEQLPPPVTEKLDVHSYIQSTFGFNPKLDISSMLQLLPSHR